MTLDSADLLALDAYLRRHIDMAAGQGFVFDEESAETCPQAFVRTWETLPEAQPIPSMFDPRYSFLHMDNFWWARFRGDAGETVCVAAQRLYDVADFREAFRTYRLFQSRPVVRWEPLELHTEAPALSGRLAVGGAFWIHPELRGQGKAYAASQVIQAITLRHFQPDYKVALFQDRGAWLRQAKAEGYRNIAPLFEGPYPPHDFRPIKLSVGWQTLAEMLTRIRAAERAAAE